MQLQDSHRRQVPLLTLLRAGLRLLRVTEADHCSHGPETVTFTPYVLWHNLGALLLNEVLVIHDALSRTVGLFLDFGQFINVVSVFFQLVLLFDNVK